MTEVSERPGGEPADPEVPDDGPTVAEGGVGVPQAKGAVHASSARRALLLTALGGLLIAGIAIAVPIGMKTPLGDLTGPNFPGWPPTRPSSMPPPVTA